MRMDKQPRNDNASLGMLPAVKTNSWAVSPGALFHALAYIVNAFKGSRRHIYQSAFSTLLCLPVFTDKTGKTICSVMAKYFGSYLLTHFSFFNLILFFII